MKVRLVASLLLVATALSPVGATAQQKVAASDTDQAIATPGGAGFTQPKAWTRTVAGTVTEVIAP